MERKWEKKQLWIIIAGLITINCLTVAFFLTKLGTGFGGNEVVATVGKEEITRQDWLKVMEERYGKDTLKELVDEKVIEAMAKKYDISISEEAVERELFLIKTMYGSTSNDTANEEEWRKQIKSSLMLEEILTKDVIVPEEDLKSYYDENINFYHIPTSYHVSQIIVKTEKEVEQAIEELENGSDFAVLAMERSIDESSAAQGGDIGFVRSDDENISEHYIKAVDKLKPGEWSEAIPVDEGFAIALLHEKINGKEYSFKEVKDEIRRVIALEQMEGESSVEAFWNEVDVEWFYGEK